MIIFNLPWKGYFWIFDNLLINVENWMCDFHTFGALRNILSTQMRNVQWKLTWLSLITPSSLQMRITAESMEQQVALNSEILQKALICNFEFFSHLSFPIVQCANMQKVSYYILKILHNIISNFLHIYVRFHFTAIW